MQKERQLILGLSDLKPCPFCGSNDIHLITTGEQFVTGYRVYCLDCHAKGPSIAWKPDRRDENEDKAKRAWNTRKP